MTHEMKLQEIYFDKIKNREKIYEIRLNDEKRQKIEIGDTIIFKKEPDLTTELQTKVTDLIHFNSFEELTNSLPLKSIGFEDKTKTETVAIFHQFYTTSQEKKYGVLAIKLNLL